jgi:hypothetical protein
VTWVPVTAAKLVTPATLAGPAYAPEEPIDFVPLPDTGTVVVVVDVVLVVVVVVDVVEVVVDVALGEVLVVGFLCWLLDTADAGAKDTRDSGMKSVSAPTEAAPMWGSKRGGRRHLV